MFNWIALTIPQQTHSLDLDSDKNLSFIPASHPICDVSSPGMRDPSFANTFLENDFNALLQISDSGIEAVQRLLPLVSWNMAVSVGATQEHGLR